jgi:flavin-dependent dehydrogenase
MPDVIVIGARCAGATTAMLLARRGYEVLLVDRNTFPSDIPRGHFVHMQGPPLLAKWGLLGRVIASGAPPITKQTLDFGDFPLSADNLSVNGVPFGIAPRRTELDEILVEEAVASGAELREGFAVQDFIQDGPRIAGVVGRSAVSGALVRERASIVIGADGRNSALARRVAAPIYEYAPPLNCWYWSYWSGFEGDALEVTVRDRRAIYGFPTNDGLYALSIAWPLEELPRVKANIEGEFEKVVRAMPGFGERLSGATREERFYGATQMPHFMRRPYGAGWALVGDAGAHKDPVLALGICDALRDAELLAGAIDDGLSRRVPMRDAMEGYERRRNNATLPLYHTNLQAASFGPRPERETALRAALRDYPEDTRQFFLAREGLISQQEFFSEANLARIFERAARRPLAA